MTVRFISVKLSLSYFRVSILYYCRNNSNLAQDCIADVLPAERNIWQLVPESHCKVILNLDCVLKLARLAGTVNFLRKHHWITNNIWHFPAFLHGRERQCIQELVKHPCAKMTGEQENKTFCCPRILEIFRFWKLGLDKSRQSQYLYYYYLNYGFQTL